MDISIVLLILASLFEAYSSQRTSTRTPKPNKIFHTFEGVDYDELPPNLYEENNDCYAHFLKCIRHVTIISPVCGWNARTWYFDDFYSPCEIELLNCKHRVKENKGIYGVGLEQELFFYNGEGYDCKYYVRMGGNMMDAYFGNSSRRMYDFEKIRNLPYRVRSRKLFDNLINLH